MYRRLHKSDWLAKRLGISVTTLERLRAKGSPDVPPHLSFGRLVRYDEEAVEEWLREKRGAKPRLIRGGLLKGGSGG